MRLVICDDHRLLLESLSRALTARGCTIEALITAPHEAVSTVRELVPDICLLDVSFPGANGLDAAREIVESGVRTKVVVLTARTDPAVAQRALDIGVAGFTRKDQNIDGILRVLRRVHAGEVVVDAVALNGVSRPAAPAPRGRRNSRLRYLTEREREVLGRLVAGEGTLDIAVGMDIAPSTARTHVQSILTKLGVHSRLQAVAVLRDDRDKVPPAGG